MWFDVDQSRHLDWSISVEYIQQTNDRVFQYDITDTHMTEIHQLEYRPGHYYHWHVDDNISNMIQYAPPPFGVARQNITEYVRKLSFSLQLTDPSEYTGGDVQIIDDTGGRGMLTIPKNVALCVYLTLEQDIELNQSRQANDLCWLVGY